MDKLRVRVYNVRFGDAILISIPDEGPDGIETQHILIDFGNVALVSGPGGFDEVFAPVITDIMSVLDGKPLDLYIMTHEHLDHVQGPLYSALKLGQRLKARYAWLTASAARDYYDTHPESKKKTLTLVDTYREIKNFCLALYGGEKGLMAAATRAEAGDASSASESQAAAMLATLLLNNNILENRMGITAATDPFKPTNATRTAHCVEFLRSIAPAENTTYVHRGIDLEGRHPFNEVKFDILAPEEDTSVYYRTPQPMALGVALAARPTDAGQLIVPKPPSGVDAGAFYSLVETRRQGFSDNLLAIDAAANDTSVVFRMEWRGWKLLFPGDAELRSWRRMGSVKPEGSDQIGVIEPVHFLKIGHHGSSNATPMDESLDKLLPRERPDNRKRVAVVSTYLDTYNNVPSPQVLSELLGRCDEVYCPTNIGQRLLLDRPFINSPDQPFVDVEFEG
jgi:beta-lactamase superfamily II metal-dependent hydrolase